MTDYESDLEEQKHLLSLRPDESSSDFPEWQERMDKYWKDNNLRYPIQALTTYESDLKEQRRLFSSKPSESSAYFPQWQKMMDEYWQGHYLRHPEKKPRIWNVDRQRRYKEESQED